MKANHFSILACRDDKKAKVVAEEIKAETKSEKIESIKLDLMSLVSVKSFAEEFKSRYQELHILINNAGIMMCPFGLSKDGILMLYLQHEPFTL
jgi:NAD(P)-dependent dehydrogenase (short-subunit alcohol dehydrogenase family)